MSRELQDTDRMPYGQYAGKPMQDVPASYFHWLWEHGKKDDKFDSVACYIRKSKHALKIETPDKIWSK